MPKLMPVAVTELAAAFGRRPAFMTFVIDGRKYSTARKKTPFILKALSEGAAAHGRVTITVNRVSFADERGTVFQTLAPLPSVITGVTLGLYRSRTRELGIGWQTKCRYTLAVTLRTPTATFTSLNTDLRVVAALVAWTRAYQLELTDPLQLATWSTSRLLNLTVAEFEALTRGTAYFQWCQTIGTPLSTES